MRVRSISILELATLPGFEPNFQFSPDYVVSRNTSPRRVLTRLPRFGNLPVSRGITQFRCPNLSENPRVSAIALGEWDRQKSILASMTNPRCLSFMGSMPIFPAFLRISPARFMEAEYGRRSFRLP